MKKLLWFCLFLPALAHADLRQPATITTFSVATGTSTMFNSSTATITNLTVTTETVTNRIGTTTNNSATVGSIGEVITASVLRSAATSLASGSPISIATMTLTAGDWDVRVMAGYLFAAGTSATELRAAISLTPNAITGGDTIAVPSGNEVVVIQGGVALVAGNNNSEVIVVPPTRILLSATTTIYYVTQATFSVSTLTGYGSMIARRER